jgi:hypothetical protein
MAHKQRRKYFVDGKVQSALIAKIVRYWIAGLVAVGGLSLLGWLFIWPGIGAFVGANGTMTNVLPMFFVAVLVALLVLPVVVLDLVWFSHRFVGPMVRLRRSMLELAAGDEVAPLRFRDDDYWCEFADAFNRILAMTNATLRSEVDRNHTAADYPAPFAQAGRATDDLRCETENIPQPV